MTVIYARTSLPSRCGGGFKNQKNVIRVTNRYTNAGPWHGVVPVKNRPIMIIGGSDTSELELSTNLLKEVKLRSLVLLLINLGELFNVLLWQHLIN